MAYKKLIKVSNVCQVLDKSKYYKTLTINGVTVTNNGDGTITVNGTATNDAYYTIISLSDTLYLSHKYLLTGQNPGLYLFVENRDKDNKLLPQLKHNIIRSLPTNTKKSTFECYIEAGRVCDNLVFKPQFFDLTEMYGAGNEPTTVAQFRQDFPEEMYDYSPHCWLTSYKRVFMTGGGNYLTSYQRNLTCKTKNLFDINLLKGITDFDVYGNSLKCFRYATTVSDTNVLNIFKSLNPNTIYTMSATVNKYISNATGRISLVFRDGSISILFQVNESGYHSGKFSLTQEKIDNIVSVIFYGEDESDGGPIIWSNIQLEIGNTTTDYVPYGHL